MQILVWLSVDKLKFILSNTQCEYLVFVILFDCMIFYSLFDYCEKWKANLFRTLYMNIYLDLEHLFSLIQIHFVFDKIKFNLSTYNQTKICLLLFTIIKQNIKVTQ